VGWAPQRVGSTRLDECTGMCAAEVEGDDARRCASEGNAIGSPTGCDSHNLCGACSQRAGVEHFHVVGGWLRRLGLSFHTLPLTNAIFFNTLKCLVADGSATSQSLAYVPGASLGPGEGVGSGNGCGEKCDKTASQHADGRTTRVTSHVIHAR